MHVILKSYKIGVSGDQSFASFIFKVISSPGLPSPVTTNAAFGPPLSTAEITTVSTASLSAQLTVIVTFFASTFGTGRTCFTYPIGTTSSQTVCQIPVTGVYQMPCG